MATTHNFKNTIVIVDGVIITGFMDGESISTEKNEDEVSTHVGADGGVTFNEVNDDTGIITLTLKQDYSSAKYLDGLRKEKRTFAAEVNDTANGLRVTGSQCRIVRAPSRTWGSEVTGLKYQILAADYKED